MEDAPTGMPAGSGKLVLNAGSGWASVNFHRGFNPDQWRAVTLDINPERRPDVLGSVADMRPFFADASFDAVWSSHNLEHLRAHEVLPTLHEFHRILKPSGFALVTCPDLHAVAALLVERGLHHVAYQSSAGPITVHDMLFGHSVSIAAGDVHMSHNTGFTQQSLGDLALQAGFRQAQVGQDDRFNLWALFLMASADIGIVRRCLASTDAEFLLDPRSGALE